MNLYFCELYDNGISEVKEEHIVQNATEPTQEQLNAAYLNDDPECEWIVKPFTPDIL
jgi:hypothetical protein